jgi:predicted nucleotidyltransferase
MSAQSGHEHFIRTVTTKSAWYPSSVIPDVLLAQVKTVLARFGGLDALWIFGSEASGRATAESDVDLAALFAAPPTPLQLIAASAELEEVLGRPVDLVDLEAASPVLAMQALSHGRLVAEGNARHRVRFMAALPGRYEDASTLRRSAERQLRARLGNGRA